MAIRLEFFVQLKPNLRIKSACIKNMLKLFTILKGAPAHPTKCILRTVFITAHQKTKQELPKETKQTETEFATIFRFPYMKYLVLLNRLKVYQTIAASLAVPVNATLTHFNYIELNTALSICAIGKLNSYIH